MKKKKFVLVLGGGSSKGFAHIGVLKVLEANGIIPDMIVGTSMGALVGGMYSAGKKVKELEKLALSFNYLGIVNLINALFKDNILDTGRVRRIIKREIGDMTFDETKIKFISVATELETGREKHFDSGLLREGIMASISVPSLFPRVKIGEHYYVDGGLLNNLPEDVARKHLPDAVIISIDPIGEYSKQLDKSKYKIIQTLINSITLMTQTIVSYKPKNADLRIEVTQPHVSQTDFSRVTAEKSIKYGERAAKAHLKEIKELLGIKDEDTKRTKKTR